MSTEKINSGSVAVIGAGMAGPLISILLARKGFSVTLFERRAIGESARNESGRSFNLTLTNRGLAAFRSVGLEKKVKAICLPLATRTSHLGNEKILETRYGDRPEDVLYSVKRIELNQLLIDAAQAEENIIVRDRTEFVEFRSDVGRLKVRDLKVDETYSEMFDYLIGADGIHSKVREALHHGRPSDLKREYFSWAYREFTILQEEADALCLNRNSLHVWPADQALLIAIPNRNGSFTGDVLLPLKGSNSFELVKTGEDWDDYLKSRYGKLASSISGLSGESISRRKTSYLQTLSTSIWTDEERTLLIGDAAHGVFPFYGQGMNSALEDCIIFDSLLDRTGGNMPEAFRLFQIERKIDTDALCELSRQHFFELQNTRSSQPGIFAKLFAGKTIYSLVAHTTQPYRDALSELKRQQRFYQLLYWSVPAVGFLIVVVMFGHSFSGGVI